jgi:hypothetical protein
MHKGGGRIVADADAQTFSVTVESLDSVLRSITFQEIDFIKIDTEGFEFDVLSGMSAILNEMVKGSCIMVETSELERMISILSPYGFTPIETKNVDHLFMKK